MKLRKLSDITNWMNEMVAFLIAFRKAIGIALSIVTIIIFFIFKSEIFKQFGIGNSTTTEITATRSSNEDKIKELKEKLKRIEQDIENAEKARKSELDIGKLKIQKYSLKDSINFYKQIKK